MGISSGPTLITSGAIVNFDARDVISYPLSGNQWFDISGNQITGSFNNGASFFSSSIYLNPSNSYVDLLPSGSFIPFNSDNTQLTLCTFIKKGTTGSVAPSGRGQGFMLFSDSDSGYINGWGISIYNYFPSGSDTYTGNRIIFNIGYQSIRDAVGYSFDPSQSIENKWIHLAVTHRVSNLNSTCSIYINGVLSFTTSSIVQAMTSPVLSVPPRIGRQTNISHQGHNSSGQLANYMLFNRVLSPDEILYLSQQKGDTITF
jgi:hypothetical protein